MSEQEVKEICVYSGEKCVLMCYGTVDAFADGGKICITETNGCEHTVYNAVVIVKEKQKNL